MAYIRKRTVTSALLLAVVVVFSQVEVADGCSDDSDCYSYYYSSSYTRYCCKRKYFSNLCRSSCVGLSCNSDDGCAPDECCDGTTQVCKTSGCDTLGKSDWVIPVIITAASVFSAAIVGLFVYALCRRATRGSARAGVVVRLPAAAGTTITANQQQQQQPYTGQQISPQMYPQSPQQYPGQTQVIIPSETGEIKY